MATVYTLDDLTLPASAHVARASWTAIIHAVGPESKPASSAHTRLAWCAERLEPFCHHMVFVVPHGSDVLVRPVLESLMNGSFKLLSLREPLGVGNALDMCRAVVKTPRVIVMAAGEMALADDAMLACMMMARQNPDAQLIFPTLMTEEGEIDCGTFFFKSAALFDGLKSEGRSFLRIIPFLDKYPGDVIKLRIRTTDLYPDAGTS